MAKAASKKSFWLVKSEPECFSIHDLAAAPGQTTCWDGVRNYQARNYLRDGMKLGDEVLYYHSSTTPPAVVGTAVVVREAYADHTAWDRASDHFDSQASPANPIWQMVDLKLQSIFPRAVPIEELRSIEALSKMELLKRGSRLSVQPVSAGEYETIVTLAQANSAKLASDRPPRRPAPRGRGTTRTKSSP